jgi:hypothetical protein
MAGSLAKVPFKSLTGAKEGYLRLRSSLKGIRERADKQIMGLARVGEIGVAAAIAGSVNGYLNEPSIGPVPVDLGLGSLLTVGGMVLGEGAGDHLQAFGGGMIGAFVYRKANRMALEAAAETAGVLRADGSPDVATLFAHRENGLNDDGTSPPANGG